MENAPKKNLERSLVKPVQSLREAQSASSCVTENAPPVMSRMTFQTFQPVVLLGRGAWCQARGVGVRSGAVEDAEEEATFTYGTNGIGPVDIQRPVNGQLFPVSHLLLLLLRNCGTYLIRVMNTLQ